MSSEAGENIRKCQKGLELLNNGDYVAAEPLLKEAVEMTKAQNNDATWSWQRCVAQSLVGQKKFEEAEPFCKKSLSGFRSQVAMSSEAGENIRKCQKGLELLNNGDYVAAEPLLKEAVEMTKAQNNDATWSWQRCVAQSLVGQKKFEEAEPFCKKSLSGFRSRWGEEDEDTLDTMLVMAEILHGKGQSHEALPIAEATLTGLEGNKKRGPDHVLTLKCKALTATLVGIVQGKVADALEMASAAADTLESLTEKMKTNSQSGSRRPSKAESIVVEQAMDMSDQVFDKYAGHEKSRRPSKGSVDSGSNPSSRAPSKQ
eukprot:CAMPEP_0180729938 /NCGR_PEP_ID=MMETSP1038_2-20121128/20360_1 /TAXON_ID=632150 /ORGANISM="Azadinium spinosum, Strain 3D9" /LENGTH=314 /DNA_ID=CAMNT_0022762679 /DNA_START=39 /DNA_END=983 /DNA_ORIENTATION=-